MISKCSTVIKTSPALFRTSFSVLAHSNRGISNKLQSQDLDVAAACDRVDEFILVSQKLRGSTSFDRFY